MLRPGVIEERDCHEKLTVREGGQPDSKKTDFFDECSVQSGTGGFKTSQLQCPTCEISPKGQKKLKCQSFICLYNSNSW